jgi:5,10-methylenetetrahydrofolate reductase
MSEVERQLAGGQPAIWLELSPPSGIEIEPLLRMLDALPAGIGAINLTDNAMGRVKLSSLVFGIAAKQRLGIPVVLNVSSRDRNLNALRSDLLAAAAYDVEGVVALRGDRIGSKAAREPHLDAMDLLRAIDEIKTQIARRNGAARAERVLYPGVVTNPYRADLAREFDLLARKAAAGARFAITQPLFDAEHTLRFIEHARALGIAPMIGIIAIRNAAMARYLKDRVRELKPAAHHLALYEGMSDEQVRELAFERNLKLIEALRPYAAGFVIMSGGEPSHAIRLAAQAGAFNVPMPAVGLAESL